VANAQSLPAVTANLFIDAPTALTSLGPFGGGAVDIDNSGRTSVFCTYNGQTQGFVQMWRNGG
jgi:hypothetical protein